MSRINLATDAGIRALMAGFPDADALIVEDVAAQREAVSVCPYDTKTGTIWWGLTLITSREAAETSGLPLYTVEER